MRIEKISDTSFRCILSQKDLADRQIQLRELAYGSAKARRLFKDMIWEASEHYGVNLSGGPLVIEAVPLQNQGIVLTVSLAEDPEELDSRFSEFTLPGRSRDTEGISGADELLLEDSREKDGYPEDFGEDSEEQDGDDFGADIRRDSLDELPMMSVDPARGSSGEDEYIKKIAGSLKRLAEEAVDKSSGGEERVSSEEIEEAKLQFARAVLDELRRRALKAQQAEEQPEESKPAAEDPSEVSSELSEAEARLSHAILNELKRRAAGRQGDKGRSGEDERRGSSPEAQRPAGRRVRVQSGRASRENLRLFTFSNLENLLDASANADFFEGESTLFHSSEGYTLVLRQGKSDLKDFNRVCNVLSEYGEGRSSSAASVAHLAEHAQRIIRGNALRKLSEIGG